MGKRISLACLGLLWLVASQSVFAQRDYQDYNQLTLRLKRLGAQYSNLCTLTSVGKTATGKEVWLLTLGRENATNKPAVVIAAGVHATMLATTELSVQMAEQLLLGATLQDSLWQLLRTKTFYIFPNLNPDASEQYHEKLRWERTGNAQPRDDDRDGRIFEDPYEDLNRDGIITLMRIEDTTGTYRVSTVDSRLMVPIEATKGEKGTHRVLSEGVDNDRDGLWNEDGEGGVNFNKNFSYNFPFFQPEAGEHPMSERESKAFADFMFSAKNVYAVFVLGPANTLKTSPFPLLKEVAPPVTAELLAKDAQENTRVTTLYHATVGQDNAPQTEPTPGDVVQWSYFHYGRFSYSTPGWWVPQVPVNGSSTTPDTIFSPSEKEDLTFMRWAESNDVYGSFLSWKPIQHPDFPGKKVEIGGFAPYAKTAPPVHLLRPVAQSHLRFFYKYTRLMPKLRLVELKAEPTAEGNTLVTAEIINLGLLPTHSQMGDLLPWVQKVNVAIHLEGGQKLVKGQREEQFKSIPGKQGVKVSWVVSGKGYVVIEANSPTAGTHTQEIALK